MLDLKLKELKELAKQHNINGRSKMNKQQLINELTIINGGGKGQKSQTSKQPQSSKSLAVKSKLSFKKVATKYSPCDNVSYMPNYIPLRIQWPSSFITIVAKYNDIWYTGLVEKQLENGKFLIKFNNGTEGEFTAADIENYKTTQCINAVYNKKNYSGIVASKITSGVDKNKHFIVFQDGSEAVLTEDKIQQFQINKSGSIIEVLWNDKDNIVNYKLTWDQDLTKSQNSILLTVDELFDYLNTPLTLKTVLSADRFQLWGLKFTSAALQIFNGLTLEEGEHKLYYENITKIRGVSNKYILSQIHKFFKLFENPTGLRDIPDHPGLEKYLMTSVNVSGRTALIGQYGLRIKPTFTCYITKGTVLGIYKGTICTAKEAEYYNTNADKIPGYKKGYQFTLTNYDPIPGKPESNLVVDPYIPGSPRGLLMYANDVARNIKIYSKTNAVFEQNAGFVEVDIYGMTYLILIALKDLFPGDEIGVDYGPSYITN